LVVTPDPSGAIGAACEAGTAANANAASTKAKTVVFIEVLLEGEAVFKVHATRQQRAVAHRTRNTKEVMSQRALLKFDRVALGCDQINCWTTSDEQIVRLSRGGHQKQVP
jgi:hypothetical protein